MSRSDSVPSYRKHKQSGQAVVTLTDGLGGRRDVLLGKHSTAASRTEYARVIAEWEANGRRLPQRVVGQEVSVNELSLAFWAHAEEHYRRPDGQPSHELEDYKLTLRPLLHLYGPTPAGSFGPLALKAVRQLLIDGYEHPKHGPQKALARGVINHRIGRIKRMFKWAVEQEMIPPSVLHGLQAVSGLQRGRSKARETAPIKPVPVAFVEGTLPHLTPQVAAMVRLQLLTGMRPGEVVVMRIIDLDTSGKVWLYRPGSDQGEHGQHKTAHHGHQRVIAIGPQGQEILQPWLRLNLHEYLFQPKEAVAAWLASLRRGRKSKVQPSQVCRMRRRPKIRPGERYQVASYDRAIARGVVKANRAMLCEACKESKREEPCDTCQVNQIPHWHPHQLRHTKATELRREHGLDVARVVLGHRTPTITEVYAELDVTRAMEVMEQSG